MHARCISPFLIGTIILILQTKSIQSEPNASVTDPVVIQIKDTEWNSQLADKSPESHNISIVGDEFILDGKPLQIHSGSLHYFRLPSEYWRDRLQKLKAAGLNSVSTYVEWSFHQPEEGILSFSRDRDIARFIRIAAEEGLYVLLRPGPYICAERDLGGFPYWLLTKYPQIKLRTSDEDFIRESRIWMAKLFNQVESLLVGHGGPIILVQVENEYGSYGADKVYMGQIRDIIKEHVGDNALLYTADGTYSSMIYDGAISGALTTINFGTDRWRYDKKVGVKETTKNFIVKPQNHELMSIFVCECFSNKKVIHQCVFAVRNVMDTIKPLRQYMPTGPIMNAEFYPGWLTHWSENIQQVSTELVVRTLRDMLQHNIHFNFYMFFGGTNFEFTAGANYFSRYLPDITSYDYDAPLTEAGDPTPKYYAIRDTILKHLNLSTSGAPFPSKKGSYGQVLVAPRVNLLSTIGRSTVGVKYKDVNGSILPSFEELKQRGGLVLYEITLKESGGLLEINKPRDWIYIYVDGKLQGIINRMNKVYSLEITSQPGSILSLLVENQGRINYGNKLHDFKGILSTVSYNNKTLNGVWSISGYLLETTLPPNEPVPEGSESMVELNNGPVIFGACFVLPTSNKPLDTFLDPTGWGKGYIWINGQNLGRYWPGVGPQVTLYVPGVWLKPGPEKNCIYILELESSPATPIVQFIDYPILNRTSY